MKANYKYKDYVDLNSISINPVPENNMYKKYRFSLSMQFKSKRNKKRALIIMKNPSEADKEKSDHTINNVLKFCEKHYGQVCIMNLFPNYSTDPKGVKSFINSSEYNLYMEQNLTVLNTMILQADDIIIAWGGNSIGNKTEYDKAIKSVLRIIREIGRIPLAVREQSKEVKREYPWHAQVWAVNENLETYEWK